MSSCSSILSSFTSFKIALLDFDVLKGAGCNFPELIHLKAHTSSAEIRNPEVSSKDQPYFCAALVFVYFCLHTVADILTSALCHLMRFSQG